MSRWEYFPPPPPPPIITTLGLHEALMAEYQRRLAEKLGMKKWAVPVAQPAKKGKEGIKGRKG